MIKRVLVGIDFSAPSRLALERAAGWARQLNLPLIGMHVIEHPSQTLFRIYAPMGDPSWFQEFEPKAQELLDQWLTPYPGSTALMETGSAVGLLAAQADAETLLVIGHVGHTGLDGMFGGTAERVIRQAKGDVLVVRAESKV